MALWQQQHGETAFSLMHGDTGTMAQVGPGDFMIFKKRFQILLFSYPSPPPPPPRAYKRREGLLIKSFVIFAVCRTAGPSDTHSLAPAARPLGARRLRETPLETCRADKGRREPDHSGTILGCDWHPVLRVQASVWGLGCAACARSPFAGCPSRVRGTELVRGKHVPRVSDC